MKDVHQSNNLQKQLGTHAEAGQSFIAGRINVDTTNTSLTTSAIIIKPDSGVDSVGGYRNSKFSDSCSVHGVAESRVESIQADIVIMGWNARSGEYCLNGCVIPSYD